MIMFFVLGMTAGCEVWYYFMFIKFLPSKNLSEVIKECVMFSYMIYRCLLINFGKVIYKKILYILSGLITGGLGYLSLIFKFCLKVGVVMHLSEEVVYFKSVIMRERIWKFMSYRGFISVLFSVSEERLFSLSRLIQLVILMLVLLFSFM